jgi:cytochrome b involved in lipid metabolism
MKWIYGIVVAFVVAVIAASFIGRSLVEDEVQTIASITSTAVSIEVSTTVGTESTVGADTTVQPATTIAGPARFTSAEIAVHNTTSSCWLLIDARIYDVTTYLSRHPAGSRTITPWCGRESTVAFDTEDGEGTHSSRAYVDLAAYEIGVLAG